MDGLYFIKLIMSELTKTGANSVINLTYLAFLIVWQPIKMLTIQVDGKGRIPFLLTLLVLFYNLYYNPGVRKMMGKKPFVIWLIWIVYAFFNMMIKGYHYDSNTPLFYFVNGLFTPYWALVLACHESLIDREKLIRVLILAFSLYCVLGFFFMGRVNSENDSSFTLGNLLAIGGSLLVFLICVARNEKVIENSTFITLMVLVVLMIIVLATRKAFGIVVILIAFYGLSLVSNKPQNIIFVVVLVVVAYVGFKYVMDNTYLGERLANTSDQAEKRIEYATNSRFLQFVGDRVPHYILGWELFKQHPVAGVGLYNFMHVSGYQERLHTDYMVQFAENGLIGIVLFALYYFWYIKNLIKLRRVNVFKSKSIIGLGWIVAVLFLGLSTWTYDMSSVFICSGVVASFVYYNKRNDSDNEQ